MKKFIVSIFLTSVLLLSVPVFAADPTNKTETPVTATQTTVNKDFNSKVNPPINGVPCPMMQNGQICPNMQGNVFYKNDVTIPAGNRGQKFMKFRFRQNGNKCFMGRPGIFRWIGMGIKFIAFLLFWILLIVLLIVLIKWILKPHHFAHCCKNNSSLDIAKERYAKGEITAEQFEEIKSKLS